MSASTLTSSDICARVRALWVAMLPQPLVARAEHNIALTIPAGFERLARAVKDTADRQLLVIEIVKAPVAGKLDLTHADFNGILIDTYRMPGAINTSAVSALVFNHAPSLDALKATPPTDPTCIWYHLRGKQLVFRDPVTGALNTYATSLSLAGSYIPELGNANRPLPGELDGQAVDRVTEAVKEMGGLAFLKMDPEKAIERVGR